LLAERKHLKTKLKFHTKTDNNRNAQQGILFYAAKCCNPCGGSGGGQGEPLKISMINFEKHESLHG